MEPGRLSGTEDSTGYENAGRFRPYYLEQSLTRCRMVRAEALTGILTAYTEKTVSQELKTNVLLEEPVFLRAYSAVRQRDSGIYREAWIGGTMQILNFQARRASVRAYLQENHDRLVAHRIRPAVVILAGGAYQRISPREQDR